VSIEVVSIFAWIDIEAPQQRVDTDDNDKTGEICGVNSGETAQHKISVAAGVLPGMRYQKTGQAKEENNPNLLNIGPSSRQGPVRAITYQRMAEQNHLRGDDSCNV